MNQRSEHLLDTAARYAAAQKAPGIVAAYAGGSVGRGVADRHSDIDLMFYCDGRLKKATASNIIYRGEAIQVHHHNLPTIDEIRASPWDFRFILDAATVHDPTGAFAALKQAAIGFIESAEGQQKVFAGAKDIVRQRCDWTADCLREGKLHTGGMAAMAAISDAAFLYGFAAERSTSTGHPLAQIGHHPDLQERIVSACPVPSFDGGEEFERRLAGVGAYTRHLRGEGLSEFATDDLQLELMSRKVRRLREREDDEAAVHELYHQTYWLVLMAYDGSLERHLAQLPDPIAEALEQVGYRATAAADLETLLAAAREIVDRAEKRYFT